ncbi:MAG: Rab family GTPase [Candidatus Helarchaeota archaeon]
MSMKSDDIYRFKVVVIGDAAVGKTSIIRKYSLNKFEENYKMTVGADFNVKLVNFDDLGEVSLTIWDFGGQEKFQEIRKYYYYGTQAAIIVFDIVNPESFKNVKKWKDDLYRETGEIPFIILANKIDLLDQAKISKDQIDQLSDELKVKIFETSAKTGENIENAFREIAKNCLSIYNIEAQLG